MTPPSSDCFTTSEGSKVKWKTDITAHPSETGSDITIIIFVVGGDVFILIIIKTKKLPHNSRTFESFANIKSVHPKDNQEEQCFKFYPPKSDFPHKCFIQPSYKGKLDNNFPFNSHSFCITSSICTNQNNLLPAATIYKSTTSESLSPWLKKYVFRQPSNCDWLQRQVHCAHGRYRYDHPTHPKCHKVRKEQQENFTREGLTWYDSAKWLDDNVVAVFIPAYPHLRSIFHFSYVVGLLAQVTSSLSHLLTELMRERNEREILVSLIFRGALPSSLGIWQRDVIQAIISNCLQSSKIKIVSIFSLEEYDSRKTSPTLCARTAVLLGQKMDINLWLFPSLGDVPIPTYFSHCTCTVNFFLICPFIRFRTYHLITYSNHHLQNNFFLTSHNLQLAMPVVTKTQIH